MRPDKSAQVIHITTMQQLNNLRINVQLRLLYPRLIQQIPRKISVLRTLRRTSLHFPPLLMGHLSEPISKIYLLGIMHSRNITGDTMVARATGVDGIVNSTIARNQSTSSPTAPLGSW
jgi:hypothetical protein